MRRIKGHREIRTLGKVLQGKRVTGLRINVRMGDESRTVDKTASTHFRSWVFSEKPSFQRYQPIYKKSKAGQTIEIQKINDPQVSVFKKVGEIKVVAELPGTVGGEINLEVFGDVLVIETTGQPQGGKVHYYKEILLPFPVEAKILDSSFNNCILEVTLRKKKEEKLL